jgi:hypothetical protein
VPSNLLPDENHRSRVEPSRVDQTKTPALPFRRPVDPPPWRSLAGHPSPPGSLGQGKETNVGRIIVANRRGHQVVEWNTTDTEEARATVEEAERILREARAAGCAISKKVDGVHVLDRGEFDPEAEEYQIVAPIAGG